MSDSKIHTLHRQRQQAYLDGLPYRQPEPTKAELRRMIAEAAANTPASADSVAAVRIARQERHA
jgi:hypothetical protein